jgi:Spy/CpxP family protein refolding chaperone
LLQNEDAQKHFNLTEEQTKKLQKISDDQRANFPRPTWGRGGDGQSAEENRKKFIEQIEKLQADVKKQINDVLTEEQQAKYKVLPFQLAGGLDTRFFNVQLFDVLNLSDDQKTQFKKLAEESQAEFRKLFTRPPEGDRDEDAARPSREEIQKQREELQKKGDELRKSIREKVVGLLTPEQKALAEKLTEEAKQLKLQPQRNERGRGERQRGDRERGERDRGGHGNNEYRPSGDSWRPGSGTPENRDDSRRPFPRRDSSTNPPPET